MSIVEPKELRELKNGLKAVWGAGDYGQIARGLERSAEKYLRRVGVGQGERMLDVACGSGQLAIPAARMGARVTGVDITEQWIDQARERARTEGLAIAFEVGDAEDLPYADNEFDLTASLIGAMFAPRPERVVGELMRVTRPGGRIVMGNWTPDGFIGRFFSTVAKYAPPPQMPSPLLWGEESTVRQRFSQGIANLLLARASLHFDYRMAPPEVADHYVEHFGPVRMASGKLDAPGREALRRDIERLWADANEGPQGTTQVTAEILEVTAVVA